MHAESHSFALFEWLSVPASSVHCAKKAFPDSTSEIKNNFSNDRFYIRKIVIGESVCSKKINIREYVSRKCESCPFKCDRYDRTCS